MIDLILGNCLEKLKELKENSIDACITDPPYLLGFMGKKWDKDGISYRIDLWQEVLRVLKPGAHLLSFGGTRTFHRMTCAIEDAGFEIRDMIEWMYSTGFPKSLNIGKQEGCEKLDGYGTALKPAHEPICMARKPLSEKTIVNNILKWGTGGLAIDNCRIRMEEGDKKVGGFGNGEIGFGGGDAKGVNWQEKTDGRFPANLIHDGSQEVVDLFPNTKPTKPHGGDEGRLDTRGQGWGFKRMPCSLSDNGGSAARFFYCAKANNQERDIGCKDTEGKYMDEGRVVGSAGGTNPRNRGAERKRNNFHPTVKPITLMKYLITLITSAKQIVLDPFMGSGTTGIACKILDRGFIGIEKEKEYFEIAEKRIYSTPNQERLV